MKSISEVEKYWNSRPCNIRHSTKPIGTKEYFDEVEKRKYFIEPHINEFANYKRWNNLEVLELGCGIGTDAVRFAKAGSIYTGVELSSESLSVAEKRFEVYNLKGKFYKANIEKLPDEIINRKYDLIYSFGVIHHTPNPDIAIMNIKKMMNEKSEFKLMLYSKTSWKNIMIENDLDQPEAQTGCPVAYTYDFEEIKELLIDFEIINMYKKHIFQYKIENYIKYEYIKEPWFESMSNDVFNALEKSLGWHTMVSCKLKV